MIPDPAPDLFPGETVLAETRATFGQFAKRFGFRAALTLPVVLVTLSVIYPITLLNLALGAATTLGLTAVYGIVFNDHLAWLAAHGNQWVLTDRRLILVSREEPQADIAISAIVSVRRWMWWSLRLRLSDGRSLRMDFVDKPTRFRDHLIAALPAGKETT